MEEMTQGHPRLEQPGFNLKPAPKPAASLIAQPFLDDDFLDQEKENIRKIYLSGAETWVCEDQGRVAGFISLLENEVGAIFVDPAIQKRGLGRVFCILRLMFPRNSHSLFIRSPSW